MLTPYTYPGAAAAQRALPGAALRFLTLVAGLLLTTACNADPATGGFRPISTQFIAALGEPDARAGTGAERWGIWTVDPGPRGVRLSRYPALAAAGGVAPAGWRFDASDWWLEENGLIMESPRFPLAAGRYLVTGDREVTTVLTIHAADARGARRWELADGATLNDVTHLGCRSARYTPVSVGATTPASCSPDNAPRNAFRVAPGAAMPPVAGCTKQDYAVLFVIGVADAPVQATLRP